MLTCNAEYSRQYSMRNRASVFQMIELINKGPTTDSNSFELCVSDFHPLSFCLYIVDGIVRTDRKSTGRVY